MKKRIPQCLVRLFFCLETESINQFHYLLFGLSNELSITFIWGNSIYHIVGFDLTCFAVGASTR